MLGEMESELSRVADHLGFEIDADRLRQIAQGPLMGRYSKALEYEYSAGLRRELIAEAETHHRRDIDDALAMLREAAEKSPLLARALARSTES
jgi:hypothetical protein